MSHSPSKLSHPEVHGHRGCRGLRPENTLSGFLYALALGVDVLELDVVISADQQVVVSHEPWFNPRTCSDPTGRLLAPADIPRFNLYRMSYAEIRRFDCGQHGHPDFSEQVPNPACKPLLREVLAAVEAATALCLRRPVGYSIEIKCSPAGDEVFHPAPAALLALVLAEITIAQVLPRTTLLCFDPRILQMAHACCPALATCLLVEGQVSWCLSLAALGFVPTTFGPDFRTVTPAATRQLRAGFPGLRLVPWTVNTLPDMRRLRALDVDGLTTDYPDRLLQLLQPVE